MMAMVLVPIPEAGVSCIQAGGAVVVRRPHTVAPGSPLLLSCTALPSGALQISGGWGGRDCKLKDGGGVEDGGGSALFFGADWGRAGGRQSGGTVVGCC